MVKLMLGFYQVNEGTITIGETPIQDYSMKWLASLTKIVIDPNRCPKSAEEFSTYEYQQDKDGNYISGYVDANNHCIDSVRYGLNGVWKKKGN